MNKVIVEVSARHLHVSQKDLETLFGEGYELTPRKELSQPGQFACEERVDIVGSKRDIKGVAILGPVRPDTQVEISLSDARSIGIYSPIRESGDVVDSGSCTLVGPKGSVKISEGVIAAKRHIHLDTATAKEMGYSDRQYVSAKIDTPERSLIFGDVLVRVNDSFAPAMHIDTDEGNAAGVKDKVLYANILD